MEEPQEVLAEGIAKTLRGMVSVPVLQPDSQLASSSFLARCRRIDSRIHKLIFVDGFLGFCHANSWKVFSDAIEDGLSLWLGFTCSHARWVEHAWCMLGDRIIETTYPRVIYYGAELNEFERHIFAERHSKQLEKAVQKRFPVVTLVDGRRNDVKYDPLEYEHSIGRERDPVTREIKPGLGRTRT